ncbi:hypothetical protein [Streptomyces sp. CRN 30]|uniref:hypothetical protein n=1 Tax=Streptomyces sp. CRN 30 TaxID=3075613 RepID=UPI002A81CCC3|nr:hypothetical protein [Streptomyces sp. CRN 30]
MTAAFTASAAAADASRWKAYRNMTPIIADASSHVEWFFMAREFDRERLCATIVFARL